LEEAGDVRGGPLLEPSLDDVASEGAHQEQRLAHNGNPGSREAVANRPVAFSGCAECTAADPDARRALPAAPLHRRRMGIAARWGGGARARETKIK
jgi:hypothetical protein